MDNGAGLATMRLLSSPASLLVETAPCIREFDDGKGASSRPDGLPRTQLRRSAIICVDVPSMYHATRTHSDCHEATGPPAQEWKCLFSALARSTQVESGAMGPAPHEKWLRNELALSVDVKHLQRHQALDCGRRLVYREFGCDLQVRARQAPRVDN
jgi:hypothetical protein